MEVAPKNHELLVSSLDGNSDTPNEEGIYFKHINKEHFYMFESMVHFLQIEKENSLLQNVSAEHLPPIKVKIKFVEFPDIEINEEDFINNKDDFPLEENVSLKTKVSDLFPDIHKHFEGINAEGFAGVKKLKSPIVLESYEDTTGVFLHHLNENNLKIDVNNTNISGKVLIFNMTPKQLITSIQKSPVAVTIFRFTSTNYEEDPASKVGQIWITLPEDFCNAVLKSSNANISKANLLEKYEIQNIFNEKIGTITLSFRLCCFGSAVITQMHKDYITQEYNFRYLPVNEAFRCYNQSKEFEEKKLTALLTDSDNILDMKKKFIPTSAHTVKPVDWKLYNQQCFSNSNNAHIETDSKMKTNDTEALLFSQKCECANILEALYKKSKVQTVLPMLEKEQHNFSASKSKGTSNCTESKLVINKKHSKLSYKYTYNKQDTGETIRKKSNIIADLNRTIHDNNEQFEKSVPVKPKESLQSNQTHPTIHTIVSLQNIRKLSSVIEITNKTDQKQRESKASKLLKKKKFLYDYTTGVYPGVLFGHKTCLEGPKYVPKTMGWLWSIPDYVTGRKKNPGWKPGLISKTISKMIKAAKGLTVCKVRASTRRTVGSKKMVLKTIPPTSPVSELRKKVYDPDEQILPTLQLYKKGEVYCIQMNTITENSEDQQDPINFKVLPDDDDNDKSIRTSKSSLAIQFVAPGALYKKPIKPDVTEVCTQYSEINFGIEEIFPPKNNSKKKNCKEKNKKRSVHSLSASKKSKRILWDDSSVPTEVSKF